MTASRTNLASPSARWSCTRGLATTDDNACNWATPNSPASANSLAESNNANVLPAFTNRPASPSDQLHAARPHAAGVRCLSSKWPPIWATVCTNIATLASAWRRSRSSTRANASRSAGDIAATAAASGNPNELMFALSQKGVTQFRRRPTTVRGSAPSWILRAMGPMAGAPPHRWPRSRTTHRRARPVCYRASPTAQRLQRECRSPRR